MKRHPRLQITLRTLLLLTAIFALWLGMKVHEARQQREAVKAVRALGGQVYYDYQLKTDPNGYCYFDPPGAPRGPAWLYNAMDIDLWATAAYVELHNPNLTNEDLAQLDKLPHLKTLFIWSAEHADGRGLEHLRGLWELEDLSLGIHLADADLDRLKHLKSLRYLFLMGPEASIVRMRGKTRVYDETTYRTQVTAEGAEQLARELPGCYIAY